MAGMLFGTDGIRNKVGERPFIHADLVQLGYALAQWILTRYGMDASLLLAYDTRISAAYINATLKSALLAYPLHLEDAGIVPIGTLSKIVAHSSRWHVGVMISASHNPYYDNGIKLICAQSGKLSAYDEAIISSLFYQEKPTNTYTTFGTDHSYTNLLMEYKQLLNTYFPPLFLKGIRIVIDCAYGACSYYAPEIFTYFGAQVIALHTAYNGTNINHECGALHPEKLQHAVIEHAAHIGFAFDGDGDRVIVINDKGNIKDGDDILALLTTHPLYASSSSIVATTMSNKGLETYLHKKGKTLIRTTVGDKYVAQELEHHNLLLGAEQSGHIILRDYVNSGDGIFAALRILETVQLTNNYAFETFTKHPQAYINIPVNYKKDLTEEPLQSHIATHQQQCTDGRVVVRYSGTENVLRLMVEHPDIVQARALITSLAKLLQKELS